MNQVKVHRRRNYYRSSIASAASTPRTSSHKNDQCSNAQFWFYTTDECSIRNYSSISSDSVFDDVNSNNNAGDSTKSEGNNTKEESQEQEVVNTSTLYSHSSVKPPDNSVFEEHESKKSTT